MRRNLNIPSEIRLSIKEHIENSVKEFHKNFLSTSSTEDSLTIKLGELLNTRKMISVNVPGGEQPGKWKWKITYNKFSDKGKNSEESYIGADGIIEIMVGRYELTKKSALFQCKKIGNHYNNTLDQAAKLSNWREASFFILFSQEKSSILSIDAVIKEKKIPKNGGEIGVDDFLIEHFLACKIGDGDIKYYADKKRLSWRSQDGSYVNACFGIRHRLRLEVLPPPHYYRAEPFGTELSLERIHDFRLDSAYEDLSEVQLKSLLKIYHPDTLVKVNDQTKRIYEIRTREIIEKLKEIRNSLGESAEEPSRGFLIEEAVSTEIPTTITPHPTLLKLRDG